MFWNYHYHILRQITGLYEFRIKIIPHNKMLLNRKDMPTSRELMRLENEIENKFINAIKNLFEFWENFF